MTRNRGVGRRVSGVVGLVLAASVTLAGPLVAQPTTPDTRRPTPAVRDARADSVLEARTREVASQLRCPVCQGESIEQSPSELAQELKSVVREQLAAGRTPDEVRQYFVGRYGEWILLRPEPTGFNYAIYVVPPLLLAAGGAFVFLLLRRWTRPAPTPDATVSDQPAANRP